MGRLATLGASLGFAQLGDQRLDGRDLREALESPPQRREPLGAEVRILRQVPEAHDQLDSGLPVGRPEREVPDPGAVRRDAVADRERQDECADGGRCEDRLRHRLGRGGARRVGELVCARARAVRVLGDVGRIDDDLDRRLREVEGEPVDVTEALGDRLRQAVVVRAEQRQPPERMRPERRLRLEEQHELLELVQPVERRHGARQRPGRRAVDPADARPEVALTQALEKAELHEDTVDGATREDDCDVALHGLSLGQDAARSYTTTAPTISSIRSSVSASSSMPEAAAFSSTC